MYKLGNYPQSDAAVLIKDVSYIIPGLFLCSALIGTYTACVWDKFGCKLPIKYIYGSPQCRWNGGRTLLQVSKFDVEKEFESVTEKEFVPLLTFSNTQISTSDLEDEMCNRLLEQLVHYKGEVICASKLLEKYIRDKFPKLGIHASVIKTATTESRDTEFYKKLSENYEYYVIHPDDNFDTKLLSTVPKHNAELLLNERCFYGCKQRLAHYQAISKEQITLSDNNWKYLNFLSACDAIPEHKQLKTKQRNISCTISEFEKLHNMGFSRFKLQGRTDNLYTLFFDIMRYTLDNMYAFPALYPVFCFEIENYYKEMGK